MDDKNKTTETKADDRNKATAPAPTEVATKQWAIGESTGNLTRDSIIEIERGKSMLAGKSEEEAHKLAVKRGFQMIQA